MQVVEVTDARGAVAAPDWLVKAERVHRQLRPALPADYAVKMQKVFSGGGRMCVAAEGLRMYVDDLVTDETQRSRGVGRTLLNHLQDVARKAGCEQFTLDSGTHREQAHKFYFREGMVIASFNFKKPLK